MRKKLLLLVLITTATIVSAQKLVVTYYDPYTKQHPAEEYYVNSAGEKNGLYKGISQRGVVEKEYNFLNGLENGVCSDFIVVNGRRILRSKVTYKNGVFNGPAVYYDPESGVPEEEGNFLNGKKHGKWTITKILSDEDIPNAPEGFKFIKSVLEINQGVIEDGIYKVYYQPSGKLYREFGIKNGKESGESTCYYPDGKLKSRNQLDSTKTYFTIKESYYQSGKLKSYFKYGEPTGYDSYGEPIRFQWSEERYESGKLKGYQNIKGDLFEIDEDGQPTAYMRNNNIALTWTQDKFNSQLELAKKLQSELDETVKFPVSYYKIHLDSLLKVGRIEPAYQLVKKVVFAYPGDLVINSIYDSLHQHAISAMAEGFYDKALEFRNRKNKDSTIAYLEKFIKAGEGERDFFKSELYEAYVSVGISFEYTDLSKAKSLLTKAYELYPEGHGACYDLACLYSLENNKEEALKYLELALKAGYKNFKWLRKDTDFNNINNLPEFSALIERYER